jgi:hypothetical protein
MAEKQKSRIEADIESLEKGAFTGEEGGAERSSPHKDFIACIVVGLFGIVSMFTAIKLGSPGNLLTAPGLLPFITGASLILMAIGLFIKTKSHHGMEKMLRSNNIKGMREYFSNSESRRTLMLMTIIGLYVIVLGQMDLDMRFKTSFYTFRLSGFELISIPVIYFILRYFWRSTVLNCFLVAAGVVISLAIIFRDGFQILLPGSG